MRTSSTLAALLLAVAGFAGQAVAQSREAGVPQAVRPEAAPLGPVPLRAVPLKVVLYPFMPGKDAYFRQVEADFEQRYPAIDLQVVDLSANYYDEGAPEAVTNTAADVIELLQQGYFRFRVVEEIELNIAIDQAAELDADEPDELAALVDFVEEFEGVADEGAGLCCVRDAALLGKRIEIGIADLDRDAAGEPGVLAPLKKQGPG